MIKLDTFLSKITTKPSFIGKDFDGVTIVLWKETNEKLSPSLEFGTLERDDGTQYLYFEVVDFGNGYKDGEVIALDDTVRRKHVINERLNTGNADEIASKISKALDVTYGKNVG